MASLCGAGEKLKITARGRERESSTSDTILNIDSELHAVSLEETSTV